MVIDNDSSNDLNDNSITDSEDDLDSDCNEEVEIMKSGADCKNKIISSIDCESSTDGVYS